MINPQINKPLPDGFKESLKFLQRLAADGFYGTVELRFEAGKIVHLFEHRSLKPTSLSPDTPEVAHVKKTQAT